MTEVGMVVNTAEKLIHKFKTTTQSTITSRVTIVDSAIHARAIKKVGRKINTHDINLTNINKILVDLDETVTRQSTTISDPTGKVERLKQLPQDNSNLESRVKILETLTAENISQTLPDIVDTTQRQPQYHILDTFVPQRSKHINAVK